ncbi:MAG: hypothetical protein LBL59_03610 [Xanthomonadaceae bacterium]|nr:hypothetical protein [Xanthomonadaceae bacterium]
MESFFTGLDPITAQDLADLSKRMFELRESRKRLLAESGCVDAEELLTALRDGRLHEHPTYEGWLAVVLLQRQQQELYEQIDWRCRHPDEEAQPPAPANDLASLASSLTLPSAFARQEMRLHPDAIACTDGNGLEVLVRIVSAQDWSFEWRFDQAYWRLDTAPVQHPGITTRAHLHRPDGSVAADPLALDGNTAGICVQRFLDALAQSHQW